MTGKGLSWCAYFPNDRAQAMMTLEDIRERDAELCAEIERLQAGWETAFNIGVSEQEQNKKLRAEIERLKEQVASLQASSGYEASIAQFEIERLRVALQQIVERYETAEDGWPAEDMRAIARAALEPKP